MFEAKVFLFALLIKTFIPNSLQIVVECDYARSSYWYLLKGHPENYPYGCYLRNTLHVNVKTTVTGATGAHSDGADENEVRALYIYDGTCEVIPSGFGTIFPNIEFFTVWNAHLKTVSSADIQQFPKLREIWLYLLDLEYLDSNLFQYNTNVEYINFKQNKIKHIGANFFDNLLNLVGASFYDNTCTSLEATDDASLETLKNEINEKCSLAGAGDVLGDGAMTIG